MPNTIELGNYSSNISILFVDHSPSKKKLVTLLQDFFLQLEVVENGLDAWNLYQKSSYDLILCSDRLEGLKGIELCEKIKTHNPSQKFLAFITEEDSSAIWNFIGQGVDGFMRSPLDETTFFATLTKQCREIYNQGQLQESNRKQEEYRLQIKKLNQDKDKFFSIISHDLKSPFNGILGLTEILADGDNGLGPDDVQQISQEVYRASKKFYNLLLNLLDWSRLQRNKIDLKPELIKFHDLVNERIEDLKMISQLKGIEIENQLPHDLILQIDRPIMGNVIHNLLNNAVKYSHPGQRVTIALGQQEHHLASIEVLDQGVGMTKKILEGLFQDQLQKSEPGTQEESGTGLGLILAHAMVNMHGGRLQVTSEPGQGTRVAMSLPLG